MISRSIPVFIEDHEAKLPLGSLETRGLDLDTRVLTSAQARDVAAGDAQLIDVFPAGEHPDKPATGESVDALGIIRSCVEEPLIGSSPLTHCLRPGDFGLYSHICVRICICICIRIRIRLDHCSSVTFFVAGTAY
jgi:hypothetical protein